MKEKKIYFFIGTIAEFFKLAPIMHEFEARKQPYKIIFSGQNHLPFKDLSGYLVKQEADIVFPKKIDKSSVIFFLFWAFRTLITAPFTLRKEFTNIDKKNAYFIIHGDPVSALIGGIIAKMHQIQLVHIESGYFSFNFLEPFPEEICRTINTHLADFLFPPTDWAANNLKKRNVPVINTGQNTLIETFWWGMKQKSNSRELKKLGKYYVLFMHRQEHVLFKKGWTKEIMDFVIHNADEELTCVVFNHPLVVEILESLDLGKRKQKIKILDLLIYPEFLQLLKNAEFVASDSATLQQELHYMGKPLLGLREYTEQTEGVGGNFVLSKGNKQVIKDFLKNYKKYETKPVHPKKRPATIVVDYLLGR